MAEDVKIDRSKTEDGRRVEQRVFETVVDGVKERVVETHIEQIPMTLQERVVEKIAPVVTNRKREVYKEGKLVDTVVEELDNCSVKMQPANPQAALTKEDLVAALREVVNQPHEVVKPVEPVVKRPVFHSSDPAPVQSKTFDIVETVFWVIFSGELAFCVYQLFLKNLL